MTRFLQWSVIGIMVILYGCMGVAVYWLFWPVRTLEITNFVAPDTVQTEHEIYRMGEVIDYQLDYCKYTSIPAHVVRTLVDGQVITLTDSHGYLLGGCHNILVQTSVIPRTINPDRYYLDILVEYQVNPFRKQTVRYHTNYFKIIR